jgi:hypothetical protein
MLRDNSQRAKNLIIFFWILFGLTVVSIVSTYMEYLLLQKAVDGSVTIDEANSNDLRQRIVGIAGILVHILVIVYFIMWFRRAYYNLHAAGCYLRFTEGWAAGAWFVPFLNLVRPFQIMKEIWDKTQERAQQGAEVVTIQSSAILGFWWFLWIVTNIAANIYTRIILTGSEEIPELIAQDVTAMILDAVDLVNILLIITIIKKISGFEQRLQETIAIENIAADEPSPAEVAE